MIQLALDSPFTDWPVMHVNACEKHPGSHRYVHAEAHFARHDMYPDRPMLAIEHVRRQLTRVGA